MGVKAGGVGVLVWGWEWWEWRVYGLSFRSFSGDSGLLFLSGCVGEARSGLERFPSRLLGFK